MKFTLTPSQAMTLKQAPSDWAALPDNISTTALRLHGIVVIRDAPGERTLNRGFQWKVTLTGMRLEGRKIKPKSEPETLTAREAIAAIRRLEEINLQTSGNSHKSSKSRLEEINPIRPILRRRPQHPVDGERQGQ